MAVAVGAQIDAGIGLCEPIHHPVTVMATELDGIQVGSNNRCL